METRDPFKDKTRNRNREASPKWKIKTTYDHQRLGNEER